MKFTCQKMKRKMTYINRNSNKNKNLTNLIRLHLKITAIKKMTQTKKFKLLIIREFALKKELMEYKQDI